MTNSGLGRPPNPGKMASMATTDPTPKPKASWQRWAEYAVWAVLAGILLYRCVLPVPSADIKPELASVRLPVDGVPTMVEFSASR